MRGLMIINSLHRRSAASASLAAVARNEGCDTRYTDFPHHAKYLASEAAERGLELVIAAGGDGTVNDVINGLAGSDTALAVLPMGTANDLATHLGIHTHHILDCHWLNHAQSKSIDLIQVNGWCYGTVGGLGLPCDVLQQMERLREVQSPMGSICRWSRRYAYLWALLSLTGRIGDARGSVRIETQGESYFCDPVSLLVANQPTVGHSFRVTPEAINDDGLCDLFVINHSVRTLKSLWAVARTVHPFGAEPDNVLRLQTKHLRLTCNQPTIFFGDGEPAVHGRVFDIRVLPLALRVLTPPATVPVTSFARHYPAIHRRVPAASAAAEITYGRTGS